MSNIFLRMTCSSVDYLANSVVNAHQAGSDGLAIGRGQCFAHFGELLQGEFFDQNGERVRGLVTLNCPTHGSVAKFFLSEHNEPLCVEPFFKQKALRTFKSVLSRLGVTCLQGRLVIDSNIPLAYGMGGSTADATASGCAALDFANQTLTRGELADLVVKAEGAADSTMLTTSRAVLFAHRKGVVIEDFGRPMPDFLVVGFNADPGNRAGIVTDTLPPANYSPAQIETFEMLRAAVRRGVATFDRKLLGSAATASATINQKYLSKPRFDQILRLVEETGALGVNAAHSGIVAGVLLDPSSPRQQLDEQVRSIRCRLKHLGIEEFFVFNNASPMPEIFQ
jgi:uncharacterized protein involved in propanediol utilization